MKLEQTQTQLNMKFVFSKDSKKDTLFSAKEILGVGGAFVFMVSFVITMISSNETIVKGTPANKFVAAILEDPTEVKEPSSLLKEDLPNFFKLALTDSQGHRYIILQPYLDIIRKLAIEEKKLLDSNAVFDITKFDNLLVNNYLLNDEFYIATLWALQQNIPDPTLMHMIQNHMFTNKDWAEAGYYLYKTAEERLLASDDINTVYTAMTKLNLDDETKLKYANHLEKLISLKVKNGTDQWSKYVENSDSRLLHIQGGYFEKKATRAYGIMLEDIYKAQRPLIIIKDVEHEHMTAYKNKILNID